MTETIISNSGFKYIETTGNRNIKGGGSRINSRTCVIKNIKTDEILFTIIGKEGIWRGRGTRAKKQLDTIGIKRFLGLDNRYYYIEVSLDKVIWGQIQSSGAVIAEDRTIIKQLNFFPMNIEIPTVPILETIPIKSIIPDTPPIKSLTSVILEESVIKHSQHAPLMVKEIEWIEQIINQIYQVMNQINQKIQSILNQLKQNK